MLYSYEALATSELSGITVILDSPALPVRNFAASTFEIVQSRLAVN